MIRSPSRKWRWLAIVAAIRVSALSISCISHASIGSRSFGCRTCSQPSTFTFHGHLDTVGDPLPTHSRTADHARQPPISWSPSVTDHPSHTLGPDPIEPRNVAARHRLDQTMTTDGIPMRRRHDPRLARRASHRCRGRGPGSVGTRVMNVLAEAAIETRWRPPNVQITPSPIFGVEACLRSVHLAPLLCLY
jgi:hypothetical protein